MNQACENARLYQPRTITTDKTHSYAYVIGEMNRFELPGEGILHISRKWKNNRIKSDHAALKKLITPMRGFKSLSSAKATRDRSDAHDQTRSCQRQAAKRYR